MATDKKTAQRENTARCATGANSGTTPQDDGRMDGGCPSPTLFFFSLIRNATHTALRLAGPGLSCQQGPGQARATHGKLDRDGRTQRERLRAWMRH